MYFIRSSVLRKKGQINEFYLKHFFSDNVSLREIVHYLSFPSYEKGNSFLRCGALRSYYYYYYYYYYCYYSYYYLSYYYCFATLQYCAVFFHWKEKNNTKTWNEHRLSWILGRTLAFPFSQPVLKINRLHIL